MTLSKEDGWLAIHERVPGTTMLTWLWCHEPSWRCITVYGDEEKPGWQVWCAKGDERGNPIAQHCYGEFELLSEAVKRAQWVRQAILDERRDVSIVEQGDLFWEDA